MSDGNASDDSRRQNRTRFATPEAPYEVTVKQTCGSLIAAARDHVTSYDRTLHDKLAKIGVLCVADFMTQCRNLHYNIASQQKFKSYSEYIPKSSQIKLDLSIEKRTKEGEDLQFIQDKHSEVLAGCQQKLKSLVIEAG